MYGELRVLEYELMVRVGEARMKSSICLGLVKLRQLSNKVIVACLCRDKKKNTPINRDAFH